MRAFSKIIGLWKSGWQQLFQYMVCIGMKYKSAHTHTPCSDYAMSQFKTAVHAHAHCTFASAFEVLAVSPLRRRVIDSSTVVLNRVMRIGNKLFRSVS